MEIMGIGLILNQEIKEKTCTSWCPSYMISGKYLKTKNGVNNWLKANKKKI